MSRLLLGGGGHAKPEPAAFIGEIRKFLGGIDRILFVPYALMDYDAYTKWMMELGYHAGYGFESIHQHGDSRKAVMEAQAIYVGGGNTFRLLAALEEKDLLSVIRERVLAGMPYSGVSAGSNVACPTIQTTNDMPIVFSRRVSTRSASSLSRSIRTMSTGIRIPLTRARRERIAFANSTK